MTYSFMENNKGKMPQADAPEGSGATERRRLAKIVHDDRGNARVEWQDAPRALERATLSIEGDSGGRPELGYDPYARNPRGTTGVGAGTRERPPKRDLRKLSEWIKQMRELEARKQRGEDDAED